MIKEVKECEKGVMNEVQQGEYGIMSEVEMRWKGRRVEKILMKIIKRLCKGKEGRKGEDRKRENKRGWK